MSLVLTVLALYAEVRLHAEACPWVSELLDAQVEETWVGVGTNGAAFAKLAVKTNVRGGSTLAARAVGSVRQPAPQNAGDVQEG